MTSARPLVVVLAALGALQGCEREKHREVPAAIGSAVVDAALLPPPPAPAIPPRKGMLWIPEGVLTAGTRPDRTPRLADEELPGEPVALNGFHIDEYAYPNEAGAIPKTGVSQEEAAALCEDLGKRLCTELEWERACKGPENTTYEYGEKYRAAECGTGTAARLSPSGLRVGCKSGFGVRDMHGGPWEWTSSAWGRGSSGQLATVKGGNGEAGELAGRCANGMGRQKTSRPPNVGFRCCSGEANTAEVTLQVVRKRAVEKRPVDQALASRIVERLPPDAKGELPEGAPFVVDRMWHWRPIGNEELLLASGCARVNKRNSCGLVVARERADEEPVVLAWVSSSLWAPRLYQERDAKSLWIYGATEIGAFRQRIVYAWGRLGLGEVERKVKVPIKTL